MRTKFSTFIIAGGLFLLSACAKSLNETPVMSAPTERPLPTLTATLDVKGTVQTNQTQDAVRTETQTTQATQPTSTPSSTPTPFATPKLTSTPILVITLSTPLAENNTYRLAEWSLEKANQLNSYMSQAPDIFISPYDGWRLEVTYYSNSFYFPYFTNSESLLRFPENEYSLKWRWEALTSLAKIFALKNNNHKQEERPSIFLANWLTDTLNQQNISNSKYGPTV